MWCRPAISPQTLTSLPSRAPLGDRPRDELQHRRVPRVVQMAHGLIGAIDRQRVLDQVVGAQRHEVEVRRNVARSAQPPALRSSRRPRCRQRADGRPSCCLARAARPPAAPRSGARASAPGGAPCHALARRMARSCCRNIAARTGSSGSRRPHRRIQRMFVTQLVDRHPVQRLVGADVDGPDRHRKALHRLDDRR